MQRTTVVIPENLRERIRCMAAERRVSMATLIREALEEKANSHRPKPRSLGVGCSSYTDTADTAGEIEYEPDPWR